MNIETANRLLQYRKEHRLSQEELAAKIGVSRQAVSKWERAEASPDTDNLILLAQIYGVTLDELLTGKKNGAQQDPVESVKPSCETDNSPESYAKSNESEGGDANANEGGYTQADVHDSGNANETQGADHVYFDNGLHVDAKNGDRVHVGWGGVYVDSSDGTRVSVDKNGVFVDENGKRKAYTDEHGHIFYDDEINREMHGNKKTLWHKFPYPVIALCVFLAWGFSDVLGGFAYSWLFLLTIPLYYTLVDAIFKKKPRHFCYPVLAVMLFFAWGFWLPWLGGFAVSWIIFLTIPIYYFICSAVEHKNTT